MAAAAVEIITSSQPQVALVAAEEQIPILLERQEFLVKAMPVGMDFLAVALVPEAEAEAQGQ
jgi:hypothetical protein